MEHEISQQNMQALKTLADANVKISAARTTLIKLQEEETEYLEVREKKAMDRIQKVVDDSKKMVKEADANYTQIHDLFTEITAFNDKLQKIQEEFRGMLEDFEERNIGWEKSIGKQQDDMEEIRKNLKVERVKIENERKSLERSKVLLDEDRRKVEDDRGTVARAIERLKVNKT